MRVCLDTNIWSFLAEHDEGAAFQRFIADNDITVVIPPGTLLEAMRTKNPERRAQIIGTLTSGSRHYLRSDAALEGDEVISEVKRLRPAWLRNWPRTDVVASLDAFWTKRIWRLARQHPERLIAVDESMGSRDRDLIVANQRRNQNGIREMRNTDQRGEWKQLNFTEMQVANMPGTPSEVLAGWPNAERVDAWRVHSMGIYWRLLVVVRKRAPWTREDTTDADWIGAYVDLDKLSKDRADFNRFWYSEVAVSNMPRNWLRWAIDVAQWERRISSSNPGDAQQGSWLVDCDIYLTADRRFADVLRMIAPHFPGSSIAAVRLIDRNAPLAVEAIARALEA
jgi:hypothetical protein